MSRTSRFLAMLRRPPWRTLFPLLSLGARDTPILLGLPAYDDAGVGYHHPDVENVATGLWGVHAGLASERSFPNYQGVALYSDWELDGSEWRHFREHFLKRLDAGP